MKQTKNKQERLLAKFSIINRDLISEDLSPKILLASLITTCFISSTLYGLLGFTLMWLLWLIGGIICLSMWRKK